MMDKLLNIGCGGHFHPAWTNIDLVAIPPFVRGYDIRCGLPFHHSSFDGCYTSHVLEHLDKHDAERLVSEQFRVLRSGGIIRVVVPDLEDKAREYLKMVEKSLQGDTQAQNRYDWIVLELLDQSVRTKVGGAMGDYILTPGIPDKEYIISRLGDEAEHWFKKNDGQVLEQSSSLWQKIRSQPLSKIINKLRLFAAEYALWIIAGGDARVAFREGVFRSSGEIHRWMYDRFSLAQMLERAGFTAIRVCTFEESSIPDFSGYLLDSTSSGTIRKSDSLFMEAVKP